MASAMVIKVRYFGTSKVKVGGRERSLAVPIVENGQVSFDMGRLREKICSTCYLPPGSDITLLYIDEDGDVVTLVDDDDLQDAIRQHLKSFRIDVLMNDGTVYRKSSSKRSTRLMLDSDGSSLGTSDNKMETNKASAISSAVDNDAICSEAIGNMMLLTGVSCDGCDCNSKTAFSFKTFVTEDYKPCHICITTRALAVLASMLMLLHSLGAFKISESAS